MRDAKAVARDGTEDLRLPRQYVRGQIERLQHRFADAPRRSMTTFESNGRPGDTERSENGNGWRLRPHHTNLVRLARVACQPRRSSNQPPARVISCLTSVTIQPERRPSPLRTIKRTQRSEEVRRQIERAIRNGDFASGERLPSERELVETFGVSRVSVREAIRSLEALGLVRVYQGRGAFVSDRRSGLGEPLAHWLDVHRDEVIELLDVRAALDRFAVECVIERYDEDDVAAIIAAQQAFRAAVANRAGTAELVALDLDFHLAIAHAAGN